MKAIKLLMAAACAAVCFVIVGPAAAAQATCADARHAADGSWVTVCDGHRIAVCDRDADGHLTYARLWPWYSPEYYISGKDAYGRNRHGRFCHHEGTTGWGIYRFAVCVQYEGCSPWRRA